MGDIGVPCVLVHYAGRLSGFWLPHVGGSPIGVLAGKRARGLGLRRLDRDKAAKYMQRRGSEHPLAASHDQKVLLRQLCERPGVDGAGAGSVHIASAGWQLRQAVRRSRRRQARRMARRAPRRASRAGDMREQHSRRSRRSRPRPNTRHCGRRSGRAAGWTAVVSERCGVNAVDEIHPGRGEAAATAQAEAARDRARSGRPEAREVE